MTDSATSGSVEQPGAVPAGAPETQPAVVENGSAAPAITDPFSGLSEGARKWVTETKGYKSPEDVVKAAQSLEQKLGSAVTLPGADATAEDWNKFYAKVGRPESADKYEFKRPESVPENLPYNADLANAAKPWMHKAGLTPAQAQVVHDEFAGYMAQQQQAAMQAAGQAVEDTHAALTREWGPTDSESFKQKHQLADRAFKKLGLLESFQKNGIVLQDGSLTDPTIAKAFAAVGETMFKEDTIGFGVIAEGANPFKDDSRNVSAQSSMVKNDPDKARRLIREAGKEPARFGL